MFKFALYGSSSFLFVNATKINQFKARGSEIKKYPPCLGNISNNFTSNNMKKKTKKKTGLNGHVYKLSADYNIIDNSID